MNKKKKILTAILTLATGTLIWIGAVWYDKPVQKDIRGNVNWSNWKGGH